MFFRAAAGFRRLSAVAGGWPSGLAVAPKVASAPRGPGFGTLAGKLLQSLPRAALFGKRLPQMSRIHAETAGCPPLGQVRSFLPIACSLKFCSALL